MKEEIIKEKKLENYYIKIIKNVPSGAGMYFGGHGGIFPITSYDLVIEKSKKFLFVPFKIKKVINICQDIFRDGRPRDPWSQRQPATRTIHSIDDLIVKDRDIRVKITSTTYQGEKEIEKYKKEETYQF